jgi:hypothetical protein
MVEVVEMVSDDLVEGEPGGAGLRFDDRRRSILAGEVAVDRICLEAIGQLYEELFRPLGVGVVATERRLSRDSVLDLQLLTHRPIEQQIYWLSYRPPPNVRHRRWVYQ